MEGEWGAPEVEHDGRLDAGLRLRARQLHGYVADALHELYELRGRLLRRNVARLVNLQRRRQGAQ